MSIHLDIIRTFLALNTPIELHQSIARIQDKLRYFPGASAIRWTRPAQFHLTLHFQGDIERARVPELISATREACAEQVPLNLELNGAGCFPSFEKPSVVWLGVTGDTERLNDVRRKFLERAGQFSEEADLHAFKPHLTLGRVKNGCHKTARVFGSALKSAEAKIGLVGTWQVRSIELMRSEMTTKGAIYTELGRAEFA